MAATDVWPLGRSTRAELEDRAAEPDHGRRQRVDGDLEGEDDRRSSGPGRTTGDGRPGAPCGARALLGDEVRRGQLADEAADRAPGQPGPGDELRA